jgi:hypothetical protein
MRRALTTPKLRGVKPTRDEFFAQPRRPITVVFDGVSRYNIGAIFRLCDAFLVQELDRGRRYGWLRLKGPLSANSTRVLLGLAVLVPVFAVLGSHQQGKAVQSLRRQARVMRVAHSSPIAKRPHSCRRPNAMTIENTTSTQLRLNAPVSDIATLLQSNPLFAETDLVALKKLLDRGRILALRPGDALLRQGEPSDAAYIVIEGSASIRIECRFSM